MVSRTFLSVSSFFYWQGILTGLGFMNITFVGFITQNLTCRKKVCKLPPALSYY